MARKPRHEVYEIREVYFQISLASKNQCLKQERFLGHCAHTSGELMKSKAFDPLLSACWRGSIAPMSSTLWSASVAFSFALVHS